MARRRHLTTTMRRASYLLAQGMDVEDVSNDCKISPQTIKAWSKKTLFIDDLEARIEKVYKQSEKGQDLETRRKNNQAILNEVYSNIHSKIANGELSDIPLRELVRVAAELSHEKRLDTDGQFTQKSVMEQIHEKVKNRFDDAESSKEIRSRPTTDANEIMEGN